MVGRKAGLTSIKLCICGLLVVRQLFSLCSFVDGQKQQAIGWVEFWRFMVEILPEP